MNGTFSRPPRNADDAHVRAGPVRLDDMFCLDYDRKVRNDYIVRFEARLFQMLPETTPKPRPGDAVLVRVRPDASLPIFWKNKLLPVKEMKTIFDN